MLSGSTAAALLLGLFGCDGEPTAPEPLIVVPADLAEGAVRADVDRALRLRLESQSAVLEESELLIWEVRQLEDRDAPSDLAVVWGRISGSQNGEWVLGQLFRHHVGPNVSWQWYQVFDSTWLELHVHESAPTNDDVAAFLQFWDFEQSGINGTLISGTVFVDAWTRVIGEPPTAVYPEGTPSP